MAKLYFYYGAMGSSKTANALMVRYNYIERGRRVLLMKPKLDTRDGERVMRSRIGLEAGCLYVEDVLDKLGPIEPRIKQYDVVIIDEAQFLTIRQVNQLANIVDDYDIPVFCYGLKTDFTGRLFEASRHLLELADSIQEMNTVCWCGAGAHFNARVAEGKVVRDGSQIQIGGNESYVALCRKHFYSGQLGPRSM